MKTTLISFLFLSASLIAQDSPFLPKYEIRNKDGKSVTINTEKITDTHIIGYIGGKRFEVSWENLDMDWIEKNNSNLFQKYKDAYNEAQIFKTYDPVPDTKKAIVQLLRGMKSSTYKSIEYERDYAGKTMKIKYNEDDEVSIGKTFSYITKVCSNYGEDLRKQKAIIDSNGNYKKDENGNKRMFTEEADSVDDNLLELSSEILRVHAKLEALPNAKKSNENVKILSKLKAMSQDVLSIRKNRAALDRTACERLKTTLEEFNVFTL